MTQAVENRVFVKHPPHGLMNYTNIRRAAPILRLSPVYTLKRREYRVTAHDNSYQLLFTLLVFVTVNLFQLDP
jgi:hypothetical protein